MSIHEISPLFFAGMQGCKGRDDKSTGLRYISGYMTGASSGYNGISAALIDFARGM